MPARRRLRWVLPTALLAGCAALASAWGETPQKPATAPAAKTLFPPNHAVLPSGGFDLITSGEKGSLEVNGKPGKWEPFRPPLRVARLHLSAGMNELKVGSQKLDVFVARYPGDEDAPSGWKTYKWHPVEVIEGTKRCNDCHQHKKWEGRVIVGEPKGYKACLKCHDSVDFGAIHFHPLQPLEACQMCHSMHGSSQKALLKAPVKKLCGVCHES